MHIACRDYFHNYPYGVYLSDLLTWAESPHLTSRLLQTERSDCKEAESIMCSCSLARLRNLENGNVAKFFQGGRPIFHRLYMSRRILRMQIKNAAIWELWVERAKERNVRKLQRRSVGIFDGKQGWDLPNRLKIPPPPILPNPPSPNRLPHTNIRTCRHICT